MRPGRTVAAEQLSDPNRLVRPLAALTPQTAQGHMFEFRPVTEPLATNLNLAPVALLLQVSMQSPLWSR